MVVTDAVAVNVFVVDLSRLDKDVFAKVSLEI